MKLFGIPYQLRQREYVIGDILISLLAIYLGHILRYGLTTPYLLEILDQYTGSSLFFISANMIMLYLVDAYNAEHDYRKRYEVLRLWSGVLLAVPLQLVAYALFPAGWWGRTITVLNTLSFASILTVWRALICLISPQPIFRQKTLVVGAGQAGHLIANLIRGNPEYDARFQLIGFIDQPRGGSRRKSDYAEDDRIDVLGAPPVLGFVQDLKQVVENQQVDIIVVALRGAMSTELTRVLLDCKAKGVTIEDMPSMYKQLAGKVPILHMTESWLIFGPVFSGTSAFAQAVERLADIFLALVGLTISAPVITVAAILVKLESPGPAFYIQERLGKNEQPFGIIKLRTMRQDAEAGTGAVWSQGQGDPRVTRVGRFLRRSRIDELPQFYNVLRGDMSVIGPRPEREHFVRLLKEKIPFYGLRFSVKPGVTGWAQVRYRYGASEEDAVEKLSYELYAVQEMSPALYILILLKTIQTVMVRPGS